MFNLVIPSDQDKQSALLAAMFDARKRVFVDLLRWDVPVLAGRFEIDAFDTEACRYLIVESDGNHAASARLLPTDRAHILDSLFPDLCVQPIPSGESILEITRFCIDPELARVMRPAARVLLISALVDYALANGIHAYIGVAESGWLQQILSFGWACRPLGPSRVYGGRQLGALRIDIAEDTPERLARNGLYTPTACRPALRRAA